MSNIKDFRAVLIPVLAVNYTFKIEDVTITASNDVELKIQAKDFESVYDALDSLVISLREFGYHTRVRSVVSETAEHPLEIRAVLGLPKEEVPRIQIEVADIPKIERRLKTFYQRIHSGWKI